MSQSLDKTCSEKLGINNDSSESFGDKDLFPVVDSHVTDYLIHRKNSTLKSITNVSHDYSPQIIYPINRRKSILIIPETGMRILIDSYDTHRVKDVSSMYEADEMPKLPGDYTGERMRKTSHSEDRPETDAFSLKSSQVSLTTRSVFGSMTDVLPDIQIIEESNSSFIVLKEALHENIDMNIYEKDDTTDIMKESFRILAMRRDAKKVLNNIKLEKQNKQFSTRFEKKTVPSCWAKSQVDRFKNERKLLNHFYETTVEKHETGDVSSVSFKDTTSRFPDSRKEDHRVVDIKATKPAYIPWINSINERLGRKAQPASQFVGLSNAKGSLLARELSKPIIIKVVSRTPKKKVNVEVMQFGELELLQVARGKKYVM